MTGGRTTISFFPSILEASHLRVVTKQTAAGDLSSAEESAGFLINQANLRFRLVDGRLARFEGGSIGHDGGFQLISGKAKLDADQFMIYASNTFADGLQMTVTGEKETFVAFDLVNQRDLYSPKERMLIIRSMDMLLNVRGAQELGRPDLAGKLIGTVTVYGDTDPIDGGGDIEPGPGDTGRQRYFTGVDVSISNMGSLTAVGRIGTFPNGTNGLAMSTTSCNVGTVNINWQAPMLVDHPTIAMNLYRLLNGRFEQVGWSWLKHGFLATNSSGCGTCQNPGTGSLLGVGCSDTYGVGNNSDRFYLGGRDEVNPFTGVWTCTNSWFSNYQPDCVRRNTGSGLDAVAHRLIVQDADMGNAGALYYYEAYYITQSDVNKYNNIASRSASMSWNGTSWTINTTDTVQTQGPAINRWGQLRSTALPRDNGDVIVASQATDLGGGMWHYEYALYNHDLDRQVREFSLNVPAGATVQNIGFHDIDQTAANDWTASVAGGKITWTSPVFGSPDANPLKYASIFNFRFDTNVPPSDGSTSLTMFKPGTGTTLMATAKVPLHTASPASFSLFRGSVVSGNLASLQASDDDRLVLKPGIVLTQSEAPVQLIVESTAPFQTATDFRLMVESSSNTVGITQTMELFDFVANAYVLIDTRNIGTSDAVAEASSTNPTRFIDGDTRLIRARVSYRATGPITQYPFTPRVDQILWKLTP